MAQVFGVSYGRCIDCGELVRVGVRRCGPCYRKDWNRRDNASHTRAKERALNVAQGQR